MEPIVSEMSRKVLEDQWEPALPQQTELGPWVTAEVNVTPEVDPVTLGLPVGHGVFVGGQEEAHIALLACLDFNAPHITGGTILNVVPKGLIVLCNPHD